jgi:hypothetical protein
LGQRNTILSHFVTADGRFMYLSHRGADSIAMFALDAETGVPAALGHEPALGENPRDIAIDPSGRFLLVANQVASAMGGEAIFVPPVRLTFIRDSPHRAPIGQRNERD